MGEILPKTDDLGYFRKHPNRPCHMGVWRTTFLLGLAVINCIPIHIFDTLTPPKYDDKIRDEIQFVVPSGNLTACRGTSSFSMGKLWTHFQEGSPFKSP